MVKSWISVNNSGSPWVMQNLQYNAQNNQFLWTRNLHKFSFLCSQKECKKHQTMLAFCVYIYPEWIVQMHQFISRLKRPITFALANCVWTELSFNGWENITILQITTTHCTSTAPSVWWLSQSYCRIWINISAKFYYF